MVGIAEVLVGAAAAAASNTVADQLSALQNSGNYGATVIYAGSKPLELVGATTRWGIWDQTPTQLIPGEPHPQELFNAWKRSGEMPRAIVESTKQIERYQDLDEADMVLFAGWAATYLQASGNRPGTFELRGRGGGVEGIATYRLPDEGIQMSFYVVGGGSWSRVFAGCHLLSLNEAMSASPIPTFWSQESVSADRWSAPTKGNLNSLMDSLYPSNPTMGEIIAGETEPKEEGPGWGRATSDGTSMVVRAGQWTCKFTGGRQSEFTLSYDYD